MPKVSVIIPTRNRAAFLQAAIQSVLNQTFQDFEIIVVDDASQDQTAEVIRSFTGPRIRYIRHETNKGQGATRNDGSIGPWESTSRFWMTMMNGCLKSWKNKSACSIAVLPESAWFILAFAELKDPASE